MDGEEGEGGGGGKISPMCESIGHRPLWGRCPKGKEVGRDKDGKGSAEAAMAGKLMKLQLENAATDRLRAARPPLIGASMVKTKGVSLTLISKCLS